MTATWYRNKMVDISNPRTAVDYTAVAIYEALTDAVTSGFPTVAAADLRAAVDADPLANTALMALAKRGLRNTGYNIVATKGRNAWYWLDADSHESQAMHDRQRNEAYTSVVGTVRAVSGQSMRNPGDVGLSVLANQLQANAINYGVNYLNMTVPDVMADIQVLTPPATLFSQP